ncbi:MAG: DUF4118 domain-containing protein [Acidobacteriaceae bacterium]|nr:DUF4118 domain-containing protein [Acidobacteriaceae bacterium]
MTSKPSALGLNSLLDQLRPLRHTRFRIALALAFVALALAFTQAAEVLWKSSVFLIFAAAVAASTALFGLVAGLVTVLFSTVAVDFFYISPIFNISLNQTTLQIAAQYTILTILVHGITRYASARVRSNAKLGIAGHLDGVVDGEVYGWALDRDNPSVPLKVVIYINDQPVAETAAVYYRPDIAAQMNTSGRHGFYVDVTKYCPTETEAVIEARLGGPSLIANGPIKAQIPARPSQSTPTVLFMHIAKTAGTAFREAITANYKQAEIAYLYPDPPGFPLDYVTQLPWHQRSSFRLVIGHFVYGPHQWFREPSTYVTVVREPFSRVSSHYLYLCKTNPGAISEGGRLLDLIEALELRTTVDLDNALVRHFSGIDESEFPPGTVGYEAYDLAVHNLHTAFSLVGHRECAEESYRVMQERFGWTAQSNLEVVNRNITTLDATQEKRIRQAVEYHNRWDYLLYTEILRIFPRPN